MRARHDEHVHDRTAGRVSRPRVVVVGLGPAGIDLLLPAARAALERIPVRYVRTARHPAVEDLAREGLELEALDLLYDTGDDLDTVYAAIAARVVEAAQEHGEIAYAVPGSPSVAERTVVLLRGAGIDIEIVPGLSFADVAWNRLGIDPMTGARVVDARTFTIDSAGFAGPMLLAQCDTRFVLSDVKLALLEVLAPEHEVTVLQGLGLPDEQLTTVALAELDQAVEPDHLTSVFVDTGDVAVAGELARLLALTERLRGPGGCPWDAAQTHHSLRRHVLEEAYEVAAAIDELPVDAPAGDIPPGAYDALEDELGDLLFQVMIHSVLASEAGAFSIADVARGVHTKLVRRHPHVFGDVEADTPDAVVTNWEQIKKGEKDQTSLVEGITPGLPALIYVQKLLRKASSIGLTPDLPSHLAGGEAVVVDEESLGVALAALAVAGAGEGIDGESALSAWANRFKERFVRMETLAAANDVDLAAADPALVRSLWDRTRQVPGN
ncbi:MAG: MazG family protein [Actinomycetia bacterium]|nr:MazG family protein [Actinomycetes bacterium]